MPEGHDDEGVTPRGPGVPAATDVPTSVGTAEDLGASGAPPAGSGVSGTGVGAGPARRTPTGGGGRWGAARRRPVRTVLMVLVLAVLAVAAGGVVWYEGAVNPGTPGPTTVVTVKPGSSVSAITATLVRSHVVGSGLAFRIFLVLHGTPVVRAGRYVLHRNDSFSDVRTRLADGPNVFAVTVLPGFTANEVAGRVDQVPGHDGAHFLALITSGAVRSPYEPAGSTVIDGLLGTGTYTVLPGESDETLLVEMIDRFDTTAVSVGLDQAAAALGVTPYQAVIVASIVQKEGVYSENLGKVARVVYNRLARGTPLQMDSTVLYSEHRDGGSVTGADLALDTPYNTYLHRGLTPTPICFPSTASLQAALAPPPGNWLYFVVVSKDGTEAFTDTYAGQVANEQLATSRGLG